MGKEYLSWTLLKLLDKYNVVIPVVQRDYAHGRKGKEHIREKILVSVYDRLKDDSSKQPLKMDFVYGEVVNDTMYPLDGQQRVTTLWLIHWYVLFMKMASVDRVGSTYGKQFALLSKMKYETRTSAEEFIKQMCTLENLKDLKEQIRDSYKRGSLANLIKTRTWFYSEWLYDPTIEAMLRTISGDAANSDACIEKIICVDDKQNYSDYWSKLKNGAVIFELQEIGTDELPLSASDDIFIKMNARGKQLSDFENFKADLIAWINDEKNGDKDKYRSEKSGNDDKKTWSLYFASQIDNAWTNVFWEKVSDGNNPFDPLFFSFVNRYVLNEICLSDMCVPINTYKTDIKKVKDEYSEKRNHFDKLSGARLKGKNADDSLITYEDFKYYAKYISFETMGRMDKVLTGYYKNSKEIDAFWERLKDNYTFIPRYDDNENKLASTRLEERVLFFITCRFLEYQNGEFDRVKFKRWMRVFHNLIRNYYYNDVSDMVNCLYLCERLSKTILDADIYEFLRDKFEKLSIKDIGAESDDDDETDDSGIKLSKKVERFESQLFEERQKAIAILNNDVNEEGEDGLIEAENYWKFDGTVRFLYRTGTGLDDVDWGNFGTRYGNSKKWFPKHNPNEKGETPTDTEVESLQSFLRLFNGFDDRIFNISLFPRSFYQNRGMNWKLDVLCNDKCINEVKDFLMQDRDDIANFPDRITDEEYRNLVKSESLLKRIIEDEDGEGKYFVYFKNGLGLINKKNASKPKFYVYIGSKQLKTIAELDALERDNPCFKIISSSRYDGYIWGRYIKFEFNNKMYVLYAKVSDTKIVCAPWITTSPDYNEEKEWSLWRKEHSLI